MKSLFQNKICWVLKNFYAWALLIPATPSFAQEDLDIIKVNSTFKKIANHMLTEQAYSHLQAFESRVDPATTSLKKSSLGIF